MSASISTLLSTTKDISAVGRNGLRSFAFDVWSSVSGTKRSYSSRPGTAPAPGLDYRTMQNILKHAISDDFRYFLNAFVRASALLNAIHHGDERKKTRSLGLLYALAQEMDARCMDYDNGQYARVWRYLRSLGQTMQTQCDSHCRCDLEEELDDLRELSARAESAVLPSNRVKQRLPSKNSLAASNQPSTKQQRAAQLELKQKSHKLISCARDDALHHSQFPDILLAFLEAYSILVHQLHRIHECMSKDTQVALGRFEKQLGTYARSHKPRSSNCKVPYPDLWVHLAALADVVQTCGAQKCSCNLNKTLLDLAGNADKGIRDIRKSGPGAATGQAGHQEVPQTLAPRTDGHAATNGVASKNPFLTPQPTGNTVSVKSHISGASTLSLSSHHSAGSAIAPSPSPRPLHTNAHSPPHALNGMSRSLSPAPKLKADVPSRNPFDTRTHGPGSADSRSPSPLKKPIPIGQNGPESRVMLAPSISGPPLPAKTLQSRCSQ